MTMLGKLFYMLRVWTGLADASESRMTPSHGWLLAAPADARRQREVFDRARDARRLAKNLQA